MQIFDEAALQKQYGREFQKNLVLKFKSFFHPVTYKTRKPSGFKTREPLNLHCIYEIQGPLRREGEGEGAPKSFHFYELIYFCHRGIP